MEQLKPWWGVLQQTCSTLKWPGYELGSDLCRLSLNWSLSSPDVKLMAAVYEGKRSKFLSLKSTFQLSSSRNQTNSNFIRAFPLRQPWNLAAGFSKWVHCMVFPWCTTVSHVNMQQLHLLSHCYTAAKYVVLCLFGKLIERIRRYLPCSSRRWTDWRFPLCRVRLRGFHGCIRILTISF